MTLPNMYPLTYVQPVPEQMRLNRGGRRRGMARMVAVSAIATAIAAFAGQPAMAAPELLTQLGDNQADRVSRYNDLALQEHLYFSRRHRLVVANAEALTREGDLVLVVFPDVSHLELHVSNPLSETVKGPRGYEQVRLEPSRKFAVSAKEIRPQLPPEIASTLTDEQVLDLAFPPIRLEVHSYDVDPEGNATLSSLNPFRHSPFWEIDESGNPFLREPTGEEARAGSSIAGPPPKTPDEIAYHRHVKSLAKNAFYSVEAHFPVTHADGTASMYSLVPLEYSPRYSILFEWDENKRILGSRDFGAEMSDENKVRVERYEAHMASLLEEDEGKRVLGEIE